MKIMKKIINLSEAIETAKQLHIKNISIVLIGGCFDILHIGHLTFLQNAKKQGALLMILLEHDENIQKQKGPNRPINTQQDRAKLLAALEIVDYVVLLPPFTKNDEYDSLVISLKPAIIATTKGAYGRAHKERQAKEIGAQVVDVTNEISDQSTTKLIKLLNEL